MGGQQTLRTIDESGHDLRIYCRGCNRGADVDLRALIDAGHGDTPIERLRWRCRSLAYRTEADEVAEAGGPAPGRSCYRAGVHFRITPRHTGPWHARPAVTRPCG